MPKKRKPDKKRPRPHTDEAVEGQELIAGQELTPLENMVLEIKWTANISETRERSLSSGEVFAENFVKMSEVVKNDPDFWTPDTIEFFNDRLWPMIHSHDRSTRMSLKRMLEKTLLWKEVALALKIFGNISAFARVNPSGRLFYGTEITVHKTTFFDNTATTIGGSNSFGGGDDDLSIEEEEIDDLTEEEERELFLQAHTDKIFDLMAEVITTDFRAESRIFAGHNLKTEEELLGCDALAKIKVLRSVQPPVEDSTDPDYSYKKAHSTLIGVEAEFDCRLGATELAPVDIQFATGLHEDGDVYTFAAQVLRCILNEDMTALQLCVTAGMEKAEVWLGRGTPLDRWERLIHQRLIIFNAFFRGRSSLSPETVNEIVGPMIGCSNLIWCQNQFKDKVINCLSTTAKCCVPSPTGVISIGEDILRAKQLCYHARSEEVDKLGLEGIPLTVIGLTVILHTTLDGIDGEQLRQTREKFPMELQGLLTTVICECRQCEQLLDKEKEKLLESDEALSDAEKSLTEAQKSINQVWTSIGCPETFSIGTVGIKICMLKATICHRSGKHMSGLAHVAGLFLRLQVQDWDLTLLTQVIDLAYPYYNEIMGLPNNSNWHAYVIPIVLKVRDMIISYIRLAPDDPSQRQAIILLHQFVDKLDIDNRIFESQIIVGLPEVQRHFNHPLSGDPQQTSAIMMSLPQLSDMIQSQDQDVAQVAMNLMYEFGNARNCLKHWPPELSN